jgi:hypothetical protein
MRRRVGKLLEIIVIKKEHQDLHRNCKAHVLFDYIRISSEKMKPCDENV